MNFCILFFFKQKDEMCIFSGQWYSTVRMLPRSVISSLAQGKQECAGPDLDYPAHEYASFLLNANLKRWSVKKSWLSNLLILESSLTLTGNVTEKLSIEISLSVAKLKARSEASRQNISNFDFWREASLRAFRFATLSHF